MSASSAAKRRNKKPSSEIEPEFQIAPMIDILLVLLVFFMSISSTEVLQSNHSVNLPIAKDAKDAKPNPGQVIINVLYNKGTNVAALEINDQIVSSGELVSRLSAHVQKNPLVRVVIRADRDVRYEFMRSLLASIGKAGIANVTFSVVDKDAHKS